MTCRDVNSCSCDWRAQSGFWIGGVMRCNDGREVVLKNAGEIECTPIIIISFN